MPISREPGVPAPYQQIREILRQEILESMSLGDRVAAERDLARRFGVNRATASRAINSLVKEGLLARRVGRGTYVASGEEAAGGTKTGTIGLLVPLVPGDFPVAAICSAVRALRERGYRTVLLDSECGPSGECKEIDRLLQERFDGALVMPTERAENEPVFARLVRLGSPVVFIGRCPPDVEADCVRTDSFWGAYEAVSRLIARGHKRIAHFTWLTVWDSAAIRDRHRGYEKALTDHGIKPDPDLICPPTPYRSDEFAFKHALAFLRSGDRPVTAVFTLNEHFCLACLAGCRALDLQVPEDLEVASFFEGNPRPHLQFVRVVENHAEVARRAVDLLLRRIEGNGPDGPQTVEIKPEIQDDLAQR